LKLKNSHYKSFIHYAFSVIITAGINFLPIFFLVRLLSADDYSKIVLAKNALFLIVSFAGFGMSQSVIRWINVLSEKNEKIYVNDLIGMSFFSFPATLLLVLLFYFMENKIHYPLNSHHILLLFFLIFFQLINFEIINWKRAEHQSEQYIKLTCLRGVAQIFSILIAVYYYRSLSSYMTGFLIAECLFTFTIGIYEIHKKQLSFKQTHLPLMYEMFLYGWPNAFIIVNGILLNTLDRYMLSYLQPNPAYVAFYDGGYILATAIMYMLSRLFNLYMSPIYMKTYTDQGPESCKNFINKMITLYLHLGFVFAFLIIISRHFLINLLFPPDFIVAEPIVFPVCLGVLLAGLLNHLAAGLYIAGRSGIVGITSAIALCINILFNILTIPRYGMLGAAYSTFAAFLAQTLLIYFLSRPYLAVKFPTKYLGLGFFILYVTIQLS
jgi:O-antigen/teichoic acid export membrane protein